MQSGQGGGLYRKLIVNNNNLATTEGQRTVLSDQIASGSNVSYVLDELNIVGASQFALKPANSDTAFRTFLSATTLTGDGSGSLQALANTQISIFTASANMSFFTLNSVAWSPSSFQITQQTSTTSVVNTYVLNTTSLFVYSSGRVVMPPSVAVSGGVTIRCEGDLFGISSLTVLDTSYISLYTSGRSSGLFSQNYYQFGSVQLYGSSILNLYHDRNALTSLSLVASSDISLRDSSQIVMTGRVQIIADVFNLTSSSSQMLANGAGYTPTMSNSACPQSSDGYNGNAAICF